MEENMLFLERFFENLEEIVYTADMDTYELCYMNRKARNAFGIENMKDICGKKCYAILQGRTTPCPFCTNKLLKVNEYFEWMYYSEVLGRQFALKNTMLLVNDRRIRIELALDMSVENQQKKTIQEYESNEKLLNEALQLALGCTREDEKPLQVFLSYIGKRLDCERMYIFEGNEKGGVDNTYEWCAEGVEPQIQNLQDVPWEVVEIWYRSFYQGKHVVIYDLEEIREDDPEMYRTLKPQGIHSLIVCPIVYKDEILGFFGVDNPPEYNMYHISTILDIMSHFILCMVHRRDLLERLERMSYCDQLTGALNRHALTRIVHHMKPDESVGVIYCDVMGLKQINDTQGHDAGDKLIQNAYRFLLERAGTHRVFRLGGDEFIILCEKVSKEAFDLLTHRVNNQTGEDAVSMAVGAVWQEHIGNGFSDLLTRADYAMYRDKKQRRKRH